MANPMKGEVQLGRYTLAFNFGTFCALEDKLDKKMPAILQALSDGLGFGEMRDFAWAGLRTHNPDITEEEVLKLLDEVGFEVAAAAIGKAVTNFFGSQKEKAKNPPLAA